MRRRLGIAVLVLLLLTLGGSWIAGSIMVAPHQRAAPPGLGRTVRLVASDGVPIAGSYWPGRRPDGPAVLLLHGVDSSRTSFARHAAWLSGQGYAVFAIDFRGHGESGQVARSFGLNEARDAAAALAFLRRGVPHRRVGLIGTSLGGAAALLGDDGPLPVQAMVLQAVYPDLRRAVFNRIAQRTGSFLAWFGEPLLSVQSWPRYGVAPGRLSPVAAIRRFNGPVLIIGGLDDRSTPPDETRELYEAAPGPKALWLVPGVGHEAMGAIWDDAYRARLLALFRASLGQP